MFRDPARRNVLILALAQGLMMAGTSTLIAEAALVGHMLAENKALATLPLALQQLTVMATTIPASLIMQRIGRRAGFTIGTACGIVATLVATWGVVASSFPLFCAGVALNGVYGGFGMYYRFAAVDGAGASLRGKAISYVMAGGVMAAALGPELAKHTQHLLDPYLFAGSFAALSLVALTGMALLQFLRIPPPVAAEGVGAGRPLAVIARQPAFVVAVLGGMIGYGGMSFVMNATPLAMIACGHQFEDSALVIQVHVLAMFLPAFWTGRIIERVGVLQVMITGAVLMLAAVLIDLGGVSVPHFVLGLMLVGLGWNFLFVGATTLVTTTYRPEEKARVQALNDFLVFGTVGAAALLAGIMHEALGWQAVNLALLPFAALSLGACWWLRARRPVPATT
jgi:MFS family permease